MFQNSYNIKSRRKILTIQVVLMKDLRFLVTKISQHNIYEAVGKLTVDTTCSSRITRGASFIFAIL